MVALAAWAVASPVGASPDEDYHLAMLYCALAKLNAMMLSAASRPHGKPLAHHASPGNTDTASAVQLHESQQSHA